jgi:hypothetical protein
MVPAAIVVVTGHLSAPQQPLDASNSMLVATAAVHLMIRWGHSSVLQALLEGLFPAVTRASHK